MKQSDTKRNQVNFIPPSPQASLSAFRLVLSVFPDIYFKKSWERPDEQIND